MESKAFLSLNRERIDGKKEGSQRNNIVRRLTFRRNHETNKDKEKRKPKRTASVNVRSSCMYHLGDNEESHHTFKKSFSSAKATVDSSEDSSIASGLTLGGSVPYDLPGTVEASDQNGGNPKHRESAVSLEGITMSFSRPQMIDVAIQCTPEGSSITQFHSPCSSPRGGMAKSEHSRRLHSVNPSHMNTTSPKGSQSLPTTPIKLRRSYDGSRNQANGLNGLHNSPLPFLQKNSRGVRRNQTFNGSRDLPKQSRDIFRKTSLDSRLLSSQTEVILPPLSIY